MGRPIESKCDDVSIKRPTELKCDDISIRRPTESKCDDVSTLQDWIPEPYVKRASALESNASRQTAILAR
eukprot:7278565-Pyramimonas_sp.AAC.1